MSKNKITIVESLPNWRGNLPDSTSAYAIGDTLEKVLRVKGSQSLKATQEMLKQPKKISAFLSEKRHELITIAVKNQDPLEIKLQPKNQSKGKRAGVPVMMVFGEPISQSSNWKNVMGGAKLPGFPLAFAIGSFDRPAILRFRPPRDGYLRLAFWIIRGPLKSLPPNAREIPKGMEKMFENNPALRLSHLINKETFMRAWSGKEFDPGVSSLDWDEALVKLTIRRGPDNAPPPRDLLNTFLKKSKLKMPENQTDEQKKWMTIRQSSHQVTVRLENTFETWLDQGKNQDIFGELNPLLIKLHSWLNHPVIQTPLRRINRYYQAWTTEDILASKVLSEILQDKLRLKLLESPASKMLKQLLESVGAIDGVIIDKYGSVIAALDPNVTVSLRTDPLWSQLENMQATEILATDSHIYLNYDFTSRTIAIRINNASKDLLGWILLELYLGQTKS